MAGGGASVGIGVQVSGSTGSDACSAVNDLFSSFQGGERFEVLPVSFSFFLLLSP